MTQNPPIQGHAPLMDGMPVVVWPHGHVAAPTSPCPEWQLLIGVLVEIHWHGLLLGLGLVDNATPSGDIAWIAADGNNGRTMIEKAGGYELSIATPHPTTLGIVYGLTSTARLRGTLAPSGPSRPHY